MFKRVVLVGEMPLACKAPRDRKPSPREPFLALTISPLKGITE
jgi:hypothetical protein